MRRGANRGTKGTLAATRAQAEALQPLGFVGKPFLAAEVLQAVERAAKSVQ